MAHPRTLAATGLALGLLTSESAWAFECARVRDCAEGQAGCVEPDPPRVTQVWNQRCLPYWIKRGDPTFNGRDALVGRSFDRWSSQLGCTDLELAFIGYTDQDYGFDPRDADDNENVVLSTRGEVPGLRDDFLAITLTSYSVESGEIFDADIIFNAGPHRFEVVEDTAACQAGASRQGPFDLENTLVHEAGHFVGLDHETDPSVTMFATAPPCEVQKRDLAPDDVNGVCTLYPPGLPPATCRPPPSYDRISGDPSAFRDQCERARDDGCGCRVGAAAAREDAAGDALAAAALALLVLGARRRRDRERSSRVAQVGGGSGLAAQAQAGI